MNTKEINRESGRIFSSLLLPNWATRSQEDQEDYGVDYEIEPMTPGDEATGCIFKVQLKGTSTPNYDSSGNLVFSGASVERFNYYIRKLQIPLIFVVCDLRSKDCYWTNTQGNHDLEDDLNAALRKNQSTFTIRLPLSRKLEKNDDSGCQIIDAVQSALDTITLRALTFLSPASVSEQIGRENNIDALEEQCRNITGIVTQESLKKMIQSGDFEKALNKAHLMLDSENEPPFVRLIGGMSFVNVSQYQLCHSGRPDAAIEAARIKLRTASQMLRISRSKSCKPGTKRFMCIYTRAARMNENAEIGLALALANSEQAQTCGSESIASHLTRLSQLQFTALVSKDFFRLRNALYRLVKNGLFSVFPSALSEIVESVRPYIYSLRILERSELADAYVNALFDVLPYCVKIAQILRRQTWIEPLLSNIGIQFIALADQSDNTSMDKLLKRFGRILNDELEMECAGRIQKSLRKQIGIISKEIEDRGEPSIDEIKAYYARQAAALGVDLNNQKDQIAQIVRIGLEDLDPTRIVKNCVHIHVMITSCGIIGEALGLHTAGSKRVMCLKYGHSIESVSLDTAYDVFAKEWPINENLIRCQDCSYKTPHPDGWTWTHQWHSEQEERYRKLSKSENEETHDCTDDT